MSGSRTGRTATIGVLGVAAVVAAWALAGCGGQSSTVTTTATVAEPTGSDGAGASGAAAAPGLAASWDLGALPQPDAVASAVSGPAELTILLDDGTGARTTWTLTCDPAGGTHPGPAMACGVLGARGEAALPEVAASTACTQQYGGPQRATITGTWRGEPVSARLGLENGCEIHRWTSLLGLLPPGGVIDPAG
jgi:hypothetical protein